LCQLMLALAVVSILPSCGKSSPDSSQNRSKLEATSFQPTLTDHKLPSVKIPAQDQAETPAWLEAAREDPDPRVRLHAVETWSAKPGKTLDPATHAMVDPDETVRARAQQLFEEALARK
jgi:hypothetical protein